MNKPEMVELLTSRSGPSKAVARDVVDAVLVAMGDTLAKIDQAESRHSEKECCLSMNLCIERTIKSNKVVHAV